MRFGELHGTGHLGARDRGGRSSKGRARERIGGVRYQYKSQCAAQVLQHPGTFQRAEVVSCLVVLFENVTYEIMQ